MSKELIDPLNEDTYDDRVIVHSGIRSVMSDIPKHKWEQAFGWKFKFIWRKNGNYFMDNILHCF